MASITVGFGLFYLTDVDSAVWRSPMDYDARVIVKGLKREEFRGYADFQIGGTVRRFDKNNVEELAPIVMGHLAKLAHAFCPGSFSLVPIPSSNMAIGVRETFRVVELAEMFTSRYGPTAKLEPILRWDAPRPKRHSISGFRHPDQFEPHLRLIGNPTRPVVLFDDVLTSGSQMIASARFLSKQGHVPQCGLAAARATKLQHPSMIMWSTETFSLDESVFDVDL